LTKKLILVLTPCDAHSGAQGKCRAPARPTDACSCDRHGMARPPPAQGHRQRAHAHACRGPSRLAMLLLVVLHVVFVDARGKVVDVDQPQGTQHVRNSPARCLGCRRGAPVRAASACVRLSARARVCVHARGTATQRARARAHWRTRGHGRFGASSRITRLCAVLVSHKASTRSPRSRPRPPRRRRRFPLGAPASRRARAARARGLVCSTTLVSRTPPRAPTCAPAPTAASTTSCMHPRGAS